VVNYEGRSGYTLLLRLLRLALLLFDPWSYKYFFRLELSLPSPNILMRYKKEAEAPSSSVNVSS
jgi:hypothetical protein